MWFRLNLQPTILHLIKTALRLEQSGVCVTLIFHLKSLIYRSPTAPLNPNNALNKEIGCDKVGWLIDFHVVYLTKV